MKIKIKTWEDLKKSGQQYSSGFIFDDGTFFNPNMREYCGKEIEVVKTHNIGNLYYIWRIVINN